jgi:hypothetical protein
LNNEAKVTGGEMTTSKTKPKPRTKAKPKAKKQTSDRVSSAAGKLMVMRRDGHRFYAADSKGPWRDVTSLVEAVCASALSQDDWRDDLRVRDIIENHLVPHLDGMKRKAGKR